jgi:glutathione-regulated potassium-efflux system ancillary protein KefC
MIDPLIILAALICGLISRALGLPALIGYLAAGFILHEFDMQGGEILQELSDIGITLLLFTIGLKLQPRDLLKSRVWATTIIHMAAMQLFFMAILFTANAMVPSLGLDQTSLLLIAFALTFSSTVFVIQVMQERGEMASRHANLAIGILVIQDLAAVIFLTLSTGKVPEPTAILLLVIWPLRRAIIKLLSHSGHGELFTLFGLALALGGAALFESQGIKGGLGALIIGAVIAGDQKSKELSRNLLQFKDLFLVCFFLSIGLSGWPQQEIIILSVVLGILALLKPLLFFFLMATFHTPPRTALLSSAALSNYSEFGLIVVAIAASSGWVDPQWSAAISLTIAVSFILSSPLNSYSHELYRKWQFRLARFETEKVRRQAPDARAVKVIVLGMGNIGTGAYDSMAERYGHSVIGVDDSDLKLARHRSSGRRVIQADASDPGFWSRFKLADIELVMLALTNHRENLLVAKLLEDLGYQGKLAAVVRFAEEADDLEEYGISAFNLYAQAGAGFAAHAAEKLSETNHEAV